MLGLSPEELYAHTPGEFADRLEARQWVRRTQERHSRGPMNPMQRKAELAKLEARIKKDSNG